jgi:16S rRNA (guanine527-N7)-methyltransferase
MSALSPDKDRQIALQIMPVSRETEKHLEIFVGALMRWRVVANLISESTQTSVWTRHIADSLQLTALSKGALRWVDMGSGAGFPGLVIAIQLANVPGAVVHCIESDRRKCAFMREVTRATGAAAQIHAARIEKMDPLSLGVVDAVTARALGSLPLTLKMADRWLKQGAVGLFPRGQSSEEQFRAVSADPTYAIEIFPSVLDTSAAVLRFRMN